MRRTKATVYFDKSGAVAYAQAKGQTKEINEQDGYGNSVDGHILSPLKKSTSRNKGNSLELEVGKVFSMWLYGEPKVLTRTPLSGGWNGSKMGDISADPVRLMALKMPLPKLYVECKNREGLLSEEFFNWVATGSPKRLSDWIGDTINKAGMWTWFLVLKGRGTEPWIFTNLRPDPDSSVIALGTREVAFYYMYPLKQLSAYNTYNAAKQNIIGG
jgi:hypothetical protein